MFIYLNYYYPEPYRAKKLPAASSHTPSPSSAASALVRSLDLHFHPSIPHYTVNKVSGFPVPSRDVTYQTLPGRE
jgi:hypothetical protein